MSTTKEGFVDRTERVELTPGDYRIKFGFPEIRAQDKGYLYMNRAESLQHSPVELDVDARAFQKLVSMLRTEAAHATTLLEVVEALSRVIDASFHVSDEEHDIQKMSEIIERGSAACDGLVLVAGLLLTETGVVNSSDAVERIIGTSFPFEDTKPHDTGHAWLRVSDGKTTVLYDPTNKFIRSYDLTAQELVLDVTDPFYWYEVAALGLPSVRNMLGNTPFTGRVRMVQGVKGGNELWMERPYSLLYQIEGETEYKIHSNGGVIHTVDGAVKASKTDAPGAARLLIPIRGIERA